MARLQRRQGNSPKRRIANLGDFTVDDVSKLKEAANYVGSGVHKRYPLNYKFPVANPRPTKSLCDAVRLIKLEEAESLMRAGIEKGMISNTVIGGFPKFIWSVSAQDEVFEMKTDANGTGNYHGYPIDNEEDFRQLVLDTWKQR